MTYNIKTAVSGWIEKTCTEKNMAEEMIFVERSDQSAVNTVEKIQQAIDSLSTTVNTVEKEIRSIPSFANLNLHISHLYSLQTALIHIDRDLKKLSKAQSLLQPYFAEEVKRKVDAGEIEYKDFIIAPRMKTTHRSVDQTMLKECYKSFYDSIIASKIAVLERTYIITIKDVETFMGSLADKVILAGEEVIDKHEIQKREVEA